MKGNKKVILVIIIVVFFVAATYFKEPNENNVSPDKTNNNETNLDNYELESENEKLKMEIEHLKESLFHVEKFIYESELANDYLPFSGTEILYKKIEDTKYVILYGSEVDNQIKNYLLVASVNPNFEVTLTIPSLDPANGINMDYKGYNEYNYFGGIITDKEIKNVQVLQNAKVHKANIFKVEDDIYGWYSIFENDRPEKLRIEALDENGSILWQESMDIGGQL
ncbi:hypothetical protein [Oceanobacillus salinisoli]|uniref:hypothetical protein n=1 Tax=Oceanobacillus salinisoli TaxID=2678611 RepID=UPI0012E1EEDF|nr:hypothetical protein [Oceanobacillus salinisoli]